MSASQPARQDSEYVRNGTASLFMVSAPLLGWRHVEVMDRRTCRDFAQVIKTLVDEQFAGAEKIVLVMDNLNTHTPASLYASFLPAEARLVAEHGGDRTFGACASVSGRAHGHQSPPAKAGRGLADQAQCQQRQD